MSWAGITNNQCVSRNNLQNAVNTGVFTLKNTIPADNKQITRTEAEFYVYINPIDYKLVNQLVTKIDLTTCTELPYAYTLYIQSIGDGYYGFSTSTAACSATTTSITVYSSSSSIGVGTALYEDICGTYQLFAVASNQTDKYYKIGSEYVTFASWDGTGYGYVIDSVGTCSSTSSATIDWSVGAQSGGNLKILNNVGTTLIDINSSAGSSQFGTVSVPYAQLPYTIRGSWLSGSGNTIKYRVCDLGNGGELFYSGPITVGDYVDYTPSPTPIYVGVYLTANNVNPPVCPE